ENCMNASALSMQDDRVRQILANRMAEIQATPGQPDQKTSSNVETGYGTVKMVQTAKPADLKDDKDVQLGGISLVTLTAEWSRSGIAQSRSIEFYVFRSG
ncbi:MAG: hypothetical protein M3Y80_01370, partial [Verrucomicrobiota bacterium]|nr:hypothetical protein [Verrucomicrobiota bacterium]